MYTTGTYRFSCSVLRRYGVLAVLTAVVYLIGLLLCVVTVVVVAAIVVCFGVVFFVRSGAGHRGRGLGV